MFDAAPTVAETLDLAFEKYDVELRLADLIFRGSPRNRIKGLTKAYFVGESRIEGKTCDHYAYRDPVVDFPVWIAKRGDPLPCRLVITTTDDPARPEYGATITWNLDTVYDASMFSFAPAEGVTEIEQVAVLSNN